MQRTERAAVRNKQWYFIVLFRGSSAAAVSLLSETIPDFSLFARQGPAHLDKEDFIAVFQVSTKLRMPNRHTSIHGNGRSVEV